MHLNNFSSRWGPETFYLAGKFDLSLHRLVDNNVQSRISLKKVVPHSAMSVLQRRMSHFSQKWVKLAGLLDALSQLHVSGGHRLTPDS